MRIILDGMGGDNAPAEIVKGAVSAAQQITDEIYIVGKPDAIHQPPVAINTIHPGEEFMVTYFIEHAQIQIIFRNRLCRLTLNGFMICQKLS